MRILLVYLEPLDNEPLGLMYIGTVLKKENHQVKIIGTQKRNPDGRILKEISHFRPEVMGISITTPFADKAQNIARLIKSNFSNISIVAGGPHPTILPYETLKDRHIDICVIGEGELTIVDLVNAICDHKPLEDIKGIAFLKNDKLVITESREYIQDLDSLPFVKRELMPLGVIYGRAGYPLGNPCMFLMSVRGCPYQCSFCQPTVDKMFGKKIRRRSPENVVREIVELKRKYDIHGLWINDDTFLFDNNWAVRFCDLMLKEKLDILWYSNGRANNADKDTLIKMRDAGCVAIVLTPETGCQRIREIVLNKDVSDYQIIRAYRICHEIGLPAQANIMLASPTETDEDLALSVSLIKKIQPHFMNVSYTTALPGTYLYDRYAGKMSVSKYYRKYEDYNIAKFKNLNTGIFDSKLLATWNFFEKGYSNASFVNRARHFFKFPYFRKILYRRWKTLIFNRHPKFRHLLFDILAIIIGSIVYFKNKSLYYQDQYLS